MPSWSDPTGSLDCTLTSRITDQMSQIVQQSRWGASTNDYGLHAIYNEIHEVELDHDVDPALAAA